MGKLEDAISALESIAQDNSVPKNIRKHSQDILERLNNKEQSIQVRLNAAISVLDDMSNDPNIPVHTRTKLWQIASLLEGSGGKH